MSEPQQDYARLCPTCGGSSVTFSELVGGAAKCRACGWGGSREELLAVPVEHMYGSREGTGFTLNNDYRSIYKNDKLVQDTVKFLVKWGFITAERHGNEIKIDQKAVLRYVSAMARSGLIAIIEEREKIEKEEKGAQRKPA